MSFMFNALVHLSLVPLEHNTISERRAFCEETM